MNKNSKDCNRKRRMTTTFFSAAFFLLFLSQGWCANSASSAGMAVTPAHVTVLMYHKVSDNPEESPDHTLVRVARFEEQMKYLKDNGYTTIDLYDLKAYMDKKISLPEKSVVLTFDDGWKSVKNAIPIMKKYNFKATFFIVLEYIDGAYPAFLTWEEFSEILADRNFDVGCHSHTHPWIPGNHLISWLTGKTPNRSRSDVVAEVAGAKKSMEDKLQRPIVHYSWPSGWYNAELLAIARDSGYITTVTTDQGVNMPGMDPMKIRRYPVYGQFSIEQFGQLLTTNFGDVSPMAGSVPAGKDAASGYPTRK